MFYTLPTVPGVSSEEFREATIGFVNPQPTKCPMLYKISTAATDNPKLIHPELSETSNNWCVSAVAN